MGAVVAEECVGDGGASEEGLGCDAGGDGDEQGERCDGEGGGGELHGDGLIEQDEEMCD